MNTKILLNIIWRFAERTASQLVSLIVSIILARLLLPEDYGVISMVTIFVSFADTLITSGLPTALIQKKNADEVDFATVFYTNVISSAVIYGFLFCSSRFIAAFFDMPVLDSVLKVLGARIITSAIYSVQYAYISRNMLFKHMFYSSLLGVVISGVLGIGSAYKGLGVWALVIQQLSSSVINVIALGLISRWYPSLCFSWRKLKELFAYGWKVLFEGISETFTTQVRNLIIGKVYTSEDLGLYTKAQQFPNLLVANVATSVSTVLLPAMSNVQDDRKQVKKLMRNAVVLTSYIMFPLSVGLALVATSFVTIVLSDKWIECVPYLQIFCFTQVATVGMIARHEAIKSIGRSDVYMYEHIIYRIIILCILAGVYKVSVMAIAMSMIIGTVIMSITVGITSKRYNDYSYREQLSDVLPIVLACVVMGIPVYFVGLINISVYLKLTMQIFTGGLIYILFSHFFKLEGYLSIIKFVVSRLHKEESVDR